ncbi:MAG: hypothetical protein FJY55_13905 [Betaproteobacteria bacterium]|nr:hypothetical protein [Betaproteobacteria bacterium]
MLLLRLLAILVVITIAAGAGAYLLTGNRKFLTFSLRMLKVALAIALLTFALLALEHLIALV